MTEDTRRPRVLPLVGPTASGKTDLAHRLADRLGARILSVDSMLVYRGMDIGTDKPTPEMLAGYGYAGVDLVAPDECCDVVRYLAAVRRALGSGGLWIAVGGTGLYFRCLLEGLSPMPPPDPALRAEAEATLREGGLPALQALVQRTAPAAWARLRDHQNPRRLIRALETALHGGPPAGAASWRSAPPPVAGVLRSRDDLRRRIAERTARMFQRGLIEETEALLRAYPQWSPTARQAIGYREAMAVLDGRMTHEAAIAAVTKRTVQLARRQMTWFRRQAQVRWVPAAPDDDPASLANQIAAVWEKHGPVDVAI